MDRLQQGEPDNKRLDVHLEVRVSREEKEIFERAAALTERTLNEFIVESTQQAAAKIVLEHEVIHLSREQQITLVTALLAPSEPGPRLQRAIRSYRQKTGQR
jgi:uncharacterized protein (DUF1778 family)